LNKLVVRVFPVRIDAPALVSLFAYANDTFIAQSFRDPPATVNISLAGEASRLRNLLSNEVLVPSVPATEPEGTQRRTSGLPRTVFSLTLEAHSYAAFKVER
jgi:hypothetical protein